MVQAAYLIGLLWSLYILEVRSHTEYPYVSFMGEKLANHSFVDLTRVGDPLLNIDAYTLQCHTDLSSCCTGSHRGDWYFPDGNSVQTTFASLYEVRRSRSVELRRRNNPQTSGMYRCDISTQAVPDGETVYVGVGVSRGKHKDRHL